MIIIKLLFVFQHSVHYNIAVAVVFAVKISFQYAFHGHAGLLHDPFGGSILDTTFYLHTMESNFVG